MNRDKFVKNNLDTLINDADIAKYTTQASEEDKKLMHDNIRESLGSSYDKYAKEYFESKGAGSYLSKFLRWSGAGLDVVGTYAFWALGGAGLGLKFLGLGAKTAADAIEGAHFERHQKDATIGDRLKIAGEGLAERAAAYLPLGVGGVADLVRGTSKYDSQITKRSVYRAKDDFIKRFGNYKKPQGPKVIPLSDFKYKKRDLPLDQICTEKAA
jgi:hypothetical protein